MSMTWLPAAAISAWPRGVRSISLARLSAGSGRRVRYPNALRSLMSSRWRPGSAAREWASLGQPDTAQPNVPEDLQVGVADVGEPGGGLRGGQLGAEPAEQPDQQLTDRLLPGGCLFDVARRQRILRIPKFGLEAIWGDMITTESTFIGARNRPSVMSGGQAPDRRCSVAQPVRRLDSWGLQCSRHWPATAPSMRSTARPTARASPPSTVISASKRCPCRHRGPRRTGAHRTRRLGGQRNGWPCRHPNRGDRAVEAAQPDHRRHADPGLHPARDVDQGSATGGDVPVRRADHFIVKPAPGFALGPESATQTGIRWRSSWSRSGRRTAGECCTRCGR